MEEVEDYFIDEEKIKQSIAGNRQAKNQTTLDSDMSHEIKDSLNTPPQAKVKENSIKTHSKNKGKPTLNSLF